MLILIYNLCYIESLHLLMVIIISKQKLFYVVYLERMKKVLV